jgi:hypothetical protein
MWAYSGVDWDSAAAALGAQRKQCEDPAVGELLDPLDLHLELALPGVLVPLLDPGTQLVVSAHHARNARHLDIGVELVVGVAALGQESLYLAPIGQFITPSR